MNKYIYSIWRRKTASAQIKLFEWKWIDTINGKNITDYVKRTDLFDTIYFPLKICKLKDKFYFEVIISGSGEKGQAEAIRYGIAKAISRKDENLKSVLKSAGLLTRDTRKVERKKPWYHKARKGMQWSKR